VVYVRASEDVSPNFQAATDKVSRWASYSTGGRFPIEVCSRVELYQIIHEKIARRASALVAKWWWSIASRSNPDHNDSASAFIQVVNYAFGRWWG
jgi:hypothetical protein